MFTADVEIGFVGAVAAPFGVPATSTSPQVAADVVTRDEQLAEPTLEG